MQVAADHDASIKPRAEELAAIKKAKQIISDSTSGAGDRSYSLFQVASRSKLQTRADLAGKEVVMLVKKIAAEQHSKSLAQLASKISAVMQFGADPFEKVKGLLQAMIAKLENEAGEAFFELRMAVREPGLEGLAYPECLTEYYVGQEVYMAPELEAGCLVHFSVEPGLPEGLYLDPTSGIISGTLAAEASVESYVVTGRTQSAAECTVELVFTCMEPAKTDALVTQKFAEQVDEITKIEDAIALYEKLKHDAEERTFRPDNDVECEDIQGNVMSQRAFEDLRRQGLV